MTKIEDAALQAMTDFIRKGAELIENEEVKSAYNKVHGSMELGYKLMGDNEEKRAWLNYVLCDQSYRLGYYLWRHNQMTDDLEKELRLFMIPDEAIEIPRSFVEKDAAKDMEISKQHMEVEARRDEIDIFKGVLAGDDEETAKRKQEEFKKRQEQALASFNNPLKAPAMQ